MTEFEEAVAAVDNTLHHAIDHWQNRALKAEALLAKPEQEPVACLSKTQAKAILDLALDLEKTGRMVVLTKGQERTDFAARNRNIQCALEDALRNATAPPAAQPKPLTDEQIYAMCSDFHSWSEWDGGNFQKFWLDLCRAIEAAHGIGENT
jgi:hypothetical protein